MTDSLRVAVDLTAAARGKAGIGRYAAELAEAVAGLGDMGTRPLDVIRFLARVGPQRLSPALRELEGLNAAYTPRQWRLRVAADYFLGTHQDRRFEPAGVDVFHAAEHLLPRLRRVPAVMTLHDATFDMYPEVHTWLNRHFLSLMVPRFLRQADAVIAVSEATKSDAVARYGIPPSRIAVTHLGVRPEFRPAPPDRIAELRRALELPDRFVLFVGTLEPRKNLGVLVGALAEVRKQLPDVQLVVAGAKGWLYDPVFAEVGARGLEGAVRFLGLVPDPDLPVLYSAADVFCMPSRFEGFGLPVLEAMACGTAVVATDRGALPEVVGDAGLLVGLEDPGELPGALVRVLEDPDLATELGSQGAERAAQFTWHRTAEETAAVYRAVAGRS